MPSTVQTIHSILAQFREEARSNRDLGDRFERLICRYLELDPIYAERFSNVWMWNEWPRKGPLSRQDYCAIGRKLGHVRLHESNWEVHLRRALSHHAQQRFCLGIPDADAYARSFDLADVKQKCLPFDRS